MKKKKKEKSLSDKVFNVVLIIVLIGFLIVVATSPMVNFSLGENKLRDSSMKETEKPVPSQLKWFDNFKGISNEKSKEEEKGSMNFMK